MVRRVGDCWPNADAGGKQRQRLVNSGPSLDIKELGCAGLSMMMTMMMVMIMIMIRAPKYPASKEEEREGGGGEEEEEEEMSKW